MNFTEDFVSLSGSDLILMSPHYKAKGSEQNEVILHDYI